MEAARCCPHSGLHFRSGRQPNKRNIELLLADGKVSIEIVYRVKATNDLRNLVYPFYTIPQEEPA